MAAAVGTIYVYSLAFRPVRAKLGREECGMKLLRVSELADGSLNFAFGVEPEEPSSSRNTTGDSSMAAAQAPVASSQLPARLPSAFQKKTPISVSTRRRERPGISRDPLTRETELPPKPAVVGGDVLSPEFKKENGLALERAGKSISEEAVSTSSPRSPGHTLPRRLKSKFVRQSPVPFTSGPVGAVVHVSAKSTVVRVGDENSAFKKMPSQVTTSEVSVHTRGDVDVDVSVQTGSINAEPAVREHAAREIETSAEPILAALSEDSSANSATGGAKSFGGLSIQGLSVSISSQESVHSGEVNLRTEALRVEDLNAYKLPDLKNLAKSRGLKGYSKLKKAELIELLSKEDHQNQGRKG